MSINSLNGAIVFPPPLTTNVPKTAATYSQIFPISQAKDIQPKTTFGSNQDIQQAVQKIQETVTNLAHNLHFSIDEDTGKTIIKVMDTNTDEVIRQIPTEEAMVIAHTLDKVQGLLFNDKA